MSVLAWFAAAGGVSSVGLGLIVWIMKIRLDGLHDDAKRLTTARKVAEAALKVAVRDFDEYRARAESKEAQLISELERYENQELDGIEKEPDRTVRIARRRQWVAGVLSQASNPTSNDGSGGVR